MDNDEDTYYGEDFDEEWEDTYNGEEGIDTKSWYFKLREEVHKDD